MARRGPNDIDDYQDDYDEYEDDYEERPRRRGRGRISERALREAQSKKMAAGICGILIGGLGIHKFVLGFTTPGVIMLLATILTCGIAGIVTGIIGLIEGIIYLTKTDEEFYQTYMVDQKEWF